MDMPGNTTHLSLPLTQVPDEAESILPKFQQHINSEGSPILDGYLLKATEDILCFIYIFENFGFIKNLIRVVIRTMAFVLHFDKHTREVLKIVRKALDHLLVFASRSGRSVLQRPIRLTPCRLAPVGTPAPDNHVRTSSCQTMK